MRYSKSNNSWELRWSAPARARGFLEDILPYVKEKKAHVNLALDFILTINTPTTAEKHRLRAEIRDKLQAVIHPERRR